MPGVRKGRWPLVANCYWGATPGEITVNEYKNNPERVAGLDRKSVRVFECRQHQPVFLLDCSFLPSYTTKHGEWLTLAPTLLLTNLSYSLATTQVRIRHPLATSFQPTD